MFCPKCRAEFEPHITVCGTCQVTLVDQLLEEELPNFRDTVCVFVARDKGRLAIAESLLQGASIPYDVQNDIIQDWVGAGRLGTGYSVVLRPPYIHVPAEFAVAAFELLSPLSEPAEVEETGADSGLGE